MAKSANNFYQYRNERIWLDLDAQTGVFRRLVLSEDRNGQSGFSKLQGCFFYREGQGVDAGFGKQILLDTTNVAKLITNQNLDAAEIFTLTESGSNLNMVRWDSSEDWTYQFCPYLSVPFGYCEILQRDGNEFFWPSLTATERDDLLDEALLIGKEFNFAAVAKSQFESLWTSVHQTRNELDYSDQKYKVIHTVDTPLFLDRSWIEYLKNERPWMPNVTTLKIRPICYDAHRDVTYSNGSTGRVYGEACYQSDGSLAFLAD